MVDVVAHKLRLEVIRFKEHVDLSRVRFDAPAGNILTETFVEGTREHSREIIHLRDVPARNVLVKRKRVLEHDVHFAHLTSIPARNHRVESIRVFKHTRHVFDILDVPLVDVLPFKRQGAAKHQLHVRDVRDVPVAEITVERRISVVFVLQRRVVEELRHIRDSGNVPGGNLAKLLFRAVAFNRVVA